MQKVDLRLPASENSHDKLEVSNDRLSNTVEAKRIECGLPLKKDAKPKKHILSYLKPLYNKPSLYKGFNEKIEAGGELEKKYLEIGKYETSKVTAKAEKPI